MQSRTRFSTVAWRTRMPSSSRPTCSSTVPFFCAEALLPPQADSPDSAASPQSNPTTAPLLLPTGCPLLLPLTAPGGGGACVVVADDHEVAGREVTAERRDRHQALGRQPRFDG